MDRRLSQPLRPRFVRALPPPSAGGVPLAAALLALILALAASSVAAATPTNCQVDPSGPNDRPGQKDITQFCVDRGDGAPFELHTVVSLDEISVTGANTIDSCSLYNLDGDAFADLAICVTLRSSGAQNDNLTEFAALRLFTCRDQKADKCMDSVLVPGPYVTTCEISHPDLDPFSPAIPGGPGDAYPYDSWIACDVDLHDFGVSWTPNLERLLDGCSFPSTIPNSDSDDCVLYLSCDESSDCSDGNACTVDSCDPSGTCVHTPAPGATCSDGLFCNGAEACNDLGFCENLGEPLTCEDGVACTIDTCDEFADACLNDPRGSLCDDGAWCNGVEACDVEAGCVAGTPPDCGDTVSCTIDACDEAADACTHAASDAACNDGRFCNGVETCDADAGCVPGTAPDCGDDVACTEDTCDEAMNACASSPVDAACDDGLFCNGPEQCHPGTGCGPGTPVDCGDGVDCTVDACVEAEDRCTNVPDDDACVDGEFCNGVEVCDPTAGCVPGEEPCEGPATCDETGDTCQGCVADADCDDGVFCNGAEACEPSTGECRAGTAVECGDAVACTADACDEVADTCTHVALPSVCDDGLFCNGPEACDPLAGCVAGPAPDCGDGIDCTADACVEQTDSCRHTVDDGACDDGRYCNGEETCDAAVGCVRGDPVACEPDDIDCSIESCNEATDSCVINFSACICGDRIVTPPEECDPPTRAGTFEDCNNGVDDNRNGMIDCDDPNCEAGSGRGKVCDELCRVDLQCARVGRDPAIIVFNRRGGPDALWVHGRFPLEGAPDPTGRGMSITISNGTQPVFSASLGVGDLEAEADGKRYLFIDKLAKVLGQNSMREGLGRVDFGYRVLDGVPHLTFRLRAYGDFSAATERVMTTQITVGDEVASLTAPWRAAPGRWYLKQSDF